MTCGVCEKEMKEGDVVHNICISLPVVLPNFESEALNNYLTDMYDPDGENWVCTDCVMRVKSVIAR